VQDTCVGSAVRTESLHNMDEPAAHRTGAGASESHDAIMVASVAPNVGVTVTGRRLPA